MVQWVESFVAKSGNPSLIPRNHTVKGEDQIPEVVLTSRFVPRPTCLHTYISKNTKQMEKLKTIYTLNIQFKETHPNLI